MVLHASVSLVLCVWLTGSIVLCDSTEFVVRETVYGNVRGYVHSVLDNITVERFLGIPYAAPPTGNLRFENPQDPESWADILNTTQLPPACPQTHWEYVIEHVPGFNYHDEDCLYLNIYVPRTPGSTVDDLAVLVYVHGGSNLQGMAGMFHGDVLAALGNIVVVAVNYRLGAFGFLTGQNADFPGNYGLLDQSFALQWVQKNIRFFDGNPAKVTVQGHSSGSSDVGLHIFSPKSKDLFRYVIMQSGVPTASFSIARPPRKPEIVLTTIAEHYGCLFSDKKRIKQCLKNVDWKTIIDDHSIIYETEYPATRLVSYIPVVDHVFISDTPENLMDKWPLNGEAFMTGVTKDECSVWAKSYGDLNIMELTAEKVKRVIFEGVVPEVFPQLIDFVLKVYKPSSELTNVTANIVAFYSIMSDSVFVAPAVDFASQISRRNRNTYFYTFEYQSPVSPPPSWLGVPHGRDLFYLFGCPFTGHPLYNYTDDDRRVSSIVIDMWSNFIKHGTPSFSSIVAEPIPRFTEKDQFYVKISGYNQTSAVSISTRPRARHVMFWNYVLPWIRNLRESKYTKMGTLTFVFISLTGFLLVVLASVVLYYNRRRLKRCRN
ncbi:cholinesterase-like [Gigantopelta aegis]|uniref:cholinesterase-like n=1 Tax=Gigantopelta aegis TaxID=1735272 RepID=UPI001B88BCBB|nr:cholinesterase-like [Gigantopelta aegis]